MSVAIFLLFSGTAVAAVWYYDVISNDQIRNAYMAGWKGLDCNTIHQNALKMQGIPKDYRESHAEFLEQTCIKGNNDNKHFNGDRRKIEKEIKYLEKLFVERIPLLKAK